MSDILVAGIDLLNLRLQAMSKRLGLTSTTQQYQLLSRQFGIDIDKGTIGHKLKTLVSQIINTDVEHFQEFLFITESSMANRIIFFKLDKDNLAPYRSGKFHETMVNSPFSDKVDNKIISEATKNPRIVSVISKNNELKIRWAQARLAISNNETRIYYFLVEACINTISGLCVIYLNKLERGDEATWKEITNIYKTKLLEFFNMGPADFIEVKLSWVLLDKLVKIMNDCPTMRNTSPILTKYKNQLITGIKFQGQDKKLKNRVIDDGEGEYSIADTGLIIEKINDPNYDLTKLSCIFSSSATNNSKSVMLDLYDNGEIHLNKGLLIEGEVNHVVNELMQRYIDVKQRPGYPVPGQVSAVPTV